MRNVEFIKKSILSYSYKNKLYFQNFDLLKIFSYVNFCRARRALSNHIKYFRKKKFHSTFELRTPSIPNDLSLIFFLRFLNYGGMYIIEKQ